MSDAIRNVIESIGNMSMEYLRQRDKDAALAELAELEAALAASQAENERLREERKPGGLSAVIDKQIAEIEKLRHDLSVAAKMCAKHATAYTRAESAESALAASEAERDKWRSIAEKIAGRCAALKNDLSPGRTDWTAAEILAEFEARMR